MGNKKSAIKELEQRQTKLEQKTEKENTELWNKWLTAEKEKKMLQEAGLQKERAKREKELKRQEEARKMELKEDQEQLKLEKAMREAFEVEEQMKALIVQEDKRTSDKRKTKEINGLRDELKDLKPGDSIEFPNENITFPKELNVGLFGTTGIGKSSLLNSSKFALKGKLDELMKEQTATANFQGGNTVRRLSVGITKYLSFIDNRGVGAEDLDNIDVATEIINQLEGRSSFAEKVEWSSESSNENTPANKDERIYCTVLVFDAQNPQSVYTILHKLVNALFEWQGRYPIGVITHVDVATQDQLENMYVVLNSAGLVDTYEVANITSEREELSLDHQLNMLKLMKRCIKEGDRIFALRERIELRKVQQAMEREREAEEARQKQARLEREKEEARIADEAEEARIEKEKEKEEARIEKEKKAKEERIEKEKKAEEAKIEKEKKAQKARIEKEKEEAVEKAKLEVIERYEKDRKAEEARITKEKEKEEARIEKEKEKEEARIENENEKEEARIEKEKAIEDAKSELIEKLEKEKHKLYCLAAIMFLVIGWLALQ